MDVAGQHSYPTLRGAPPNPSRRRGLLPDGCAIVVPELNVHYRELLSPGALLRENADSALLAALETELLFLHRASDETLRQYAEDWRRVQRASAAAGRLARARRANGACLGPDAFWSSAFTDHCEPLVDLALLAAVRLPHPTAHRPVGQSARLRTGLRGLMSPTSDVGAHIVAMVGEWASGELRRRACWRLRVQGASYSEPIVPAQVTLSPSRRTRAPNTAEGLCPVPLREAA